MKAIHVPHSSIPANQVGHIEGEPDAVAHRLSEIPDLIEPWH
jgi:putative hydrolase of the HAD superfamily